MSSNLTVPTILEIVGIGGMPGFIENFRKGGKKIETPFLVRQVETHLVFGPLARYFPAGGLFLVAAALFLGWSLLAGHEPIAQKIGDVVDKLIFLPIGLLLLTWTKRQQAIVAWCSVKGGLGLGAAIVATVGAGVSFSQGYSDAWALLFLGLIWIPALEFIPKVTPHQRYLTIARIVLSIPCVYFGIKSGNWHW